MYACSASRSGWTVNWRSSFPAPPPGPFPFGGWTSLGARIGAHLPQAVPQRDPQPAGDLRRQMGHQTGAGPADLLDREHDPDLAVVVVVADRHRPRHRGEVRVLGDGRILGWVEGVVVDGSP